MKRLATPLTLVLIALTVAAIVALTLSESSHESNGSKMWAPPDNWIEMSLRDSVVSRDGGHQSGRLSSDGDWVAIAIELRDDSDGRPVSCVELRFESSYDEPTETCTSAAADSLTSFGLTDPDSAGLAVLDWSGLSSSVEYAALITKSATYWQVPFNGVAVFLTRLVTTEQFSLVAYDAKGVELRRDQNVGV